MGTRTGSRGSPRRCSGGQSRRDRNEQKEVMTMNETHGRVYGRLIDQHEAVCG